MKRWVFIIPLLLMMVPMPALAKNDVNVKIDSEDEVLNFKGYAGEKEVFIDNLRLTAKGGDVDRFRITVDDLKEVDGGREVPRTQVKFAGDRTLRDGLPKNFPVIIRDVVEEPATYEGKADILPMGKSQFENVEQIELKLKAKANPSLSTAAQEGPLAVVPVWVIFVLLGAIILLPILAIVFGRLTGVMDEDKRTWLDYGNFYIVASGIAAVVFGFVVTLLVAGPFEDTTQALGFLTAFFGAVVGLVGTYFGIKQSADAAAEAHRGRRDAEGRSNSGGQGPPPGGRP